MKKLLLLFLLVWHVQFFDGTFGDGDAQVRAQLDLMNKLSNDPKVLRVIPVTQMRWYGVYWLEKVDKGEVNE